MSAVLGAVVVPLMLLIPGFVLVAVYRRNRHGNDPSDARFIAASLVASVFPHLALVWWTVPLFQRVQQHPTRLSSGEVAAWLVLLALIIPSALGYGLSAFIEIPTIDRVLGGFGWSRWARTRTAWEWWLTPAQPGWVVVTLRNGRLAGGKFGQGSFASLDPRQRDLFIAEPYQVLQDGTFGQPVESSQGLWVSGTEIESVEFYEGG